MQSLSLGASNSSDQRTLSFGGLLMNGVSPQKPYVEGITCNMMVLGNGGFGRPLGLD